MIDNSLIPITIRITPDQMLYFKSNKIQIADFIRDLLEEAIYDINKLDKQIKELKERREWVATMLKNKEKEEKIILKGELEFLQESKTILKNRPDLLQGRVSWYENVYGKKVTKPKFLQILENLEVK